MEKTNYLDELHDGWQQCAGCFRVVMKAHVDASGRCVDCPAPSDPAKGETAETVDNAPQAGKKAKG